MIVLAALLTLCVIGLPVAIAIDPRTRGALLAGLAFLYGAGVVFLVQLAFSMAGVAWSAAGVTAFSIAAAMVVFALARSGGAPTPEPQPQQTPGGSAVVIDAITLLVFIAYIAFCVAARVWEWDFWAIWGLKGRVFFEASGVDWKFLSSRWNDYAHPDYPLLLPLNYAYAALLEGGWNDRWMGLYSAAFAGAVLLVVRSLARRESSALVSASVTLAATAFAMTDAVGLADVPLTAYGAASILMIRRALHDHDRASFRHGAVLLGFAASCKNEGLALVIAVAVAVAIASWRNVVRIWPAVAIAGPWVIIRSIHGLKGDLFTGDVLARVVARAGDAGPLLGQLLHHLSDRWLWLFLFAGLLLFPWARLRRESFTLIAVGLQLLFFVGVYFATANDPEWQISFSWWRLTRQVGIPLLFVVMTNLGSTTETRSENSKGA